ncbi:hypothetical protein Pan216_33080 [Planctomycetes bacterium Pan216]|uniref:Alpha/beta hydrolase family protein n=1 Tax=Kolteria novifilia TaxID=2527975 RepID=A0A518B634_9BACT|nr:hypothetical protein Pan216_33080 [Planctomycetes bacterium Pan216]
MLMDAAPRRRANGAFGRGRISLWLLGLAVLLPSGGCTSPNWNTIPAQGHVAGRFIDTTVDSYWAKYYLENTLNGHRVDPCMDARIDSAVERSRTSIRCSQTLQWLTNCYSTDFAALVFANDLAHDPHSAELQRLYLQERDEIKVEGLRDLEPPAIDRSKVLFVFVPGWFYESMPKNDADFSEERAFLEEQGWSTELVHIGDNTSVEKNAHMLAQALRCYHRRGVNIILISTSMGGPETAMALGTLLCPEETSNILCWISINGAMRGSPLADRAMRIPTRFLVAGYFRYKGWGGMAGMRSLTTKRSIKRFSHVRIPEHIVLVNWISIPLSGQVSKQAQGGYKYMRKFGPNDGIIMCNSEFVPGAAILVGIGLDHFFRDPDHEATILALTRAVQQYTVLKNPAAAALAPNVDMIPSGSTNIVPVPPLTQMPLESPKLH